MEPTAPKSWPHPWPEDRVATLHCPGIAIGDPLRERLQRIREQQMADHRFGRPQLVCTTFYDQEVVCLRAGGGHAAYLGLDGQVHYENYGEGFDAVVLTDPRDVASAIVKCAADIGVPELIDLLPTKPESAFVCGLCKGSRWMPAEVMTSDDGRSICCLRCYGLGWTLAE
jgi:hypothetical protein